MVGGSGIRMGTVEAVTGGGTLAIADGLAGSFSATFVPAALETAVLNRCCV